jgi:hypothetical protein
VNNKRDPAGQSADGPPGQLNAEAGERDLRDFGLGLVLLASVAALAYSVAVDTDMHQNFGLDPGPAFLPDVLLWLLGIGAAILVVLGAVSLTRAGWQVEPPTDTIKNSLVPLLMIGSIILYVLLVPIVGFLAASLMFSIAWALALGFQDYGYARRPLLMSAAGSVAAAIAIYLTFKELIGIPLG